MPLGPIDAIPDNEPNRYRRGTSYGGDHHADDEQRVGTSAFRARAPAIVANRSRNAFLKDLQNLRQAIELGSDSI